VADPDEDDARGRMMAGYSKAEEKNRKVRESLVPLAPGERPTVITVGAIFSAVVATIFWVSTGVAVFTDAEVNGSKPNMVQLIGTGLIMTLMAWGLWRAKYWAALGFQALLLLFILAAVAGLVLAGTLLQLISTLLLTGFLGAMFWFMVKAMARLQMPERPGSD
jgi:hypothetical protein